MARAEHQKTPVSISKKPGHKDKTPITLYEYIDRLDKRLPPIERSSDEIAKLDMPLIDLDAVEKASKSE